MFAFDLALALVFAVAFALALALFALANALAFALCALALAVSRAAQTLQQRDCPMRCPRHVSCVCLTLAPRAASC